MKVLVLGATGMAGHMITSYFQEKGHDVTAFSVVPVDYCNCIVGDALDEKFFTNMLVEGDYQGVINCIGILNQAAEEQPSLAVYLNGYLPHLIADTLRQSATKLIHMSTDCVFSGKTGNYNEHSLRDGETFYDRTKAIGEIDDNKNLTFRNSIIGPDRNENGIGLFNWFMKQEGTIHGYTKAMWTGVTTLTLAKAMEQALREDITGIYNLVNNVAISKYDLLRCFNQHFKENRLTILPSEDVKSNKSLVNNRTDFSFKVPSYNQMIIEMKEWILNHKECYPQYFN